MTRLKNHESRCALCQMRNELCLCVDAAALKSSLRVRSQVTVIMHHRERYLTTNTARLATLCIPGCQIFLRGLEDKPLQWDTVLDPEKQPLFLYPCEEAQVLSDDFVKLFNRPIQLIVPDGSWRQASKVAHREPALKDIPRVTLAVGAQSEYLLRREPKENGLATFEAIARALGVLEGEKVSNSLMEVFKIMVSRTLKSRGFSV